ncbi:glycosyltransferase family 2 protein [Priestia megaterium]|uniref:glycosyltransferase family 2 protein n=1 Tax=Priestia megaterium TaxID=1404 RepID=UPI001C214E5C|nr:glycosyltransferase family 2 protein [Priestia megaterium]MBU8589672.1 glycosyltransferase family 2 protein [Priestia megaterium]
MLLSVVVPCFNEEKNVHSFYEYTTKILAMENFNYELIFVNDGSSDNTIDCLKELSETHEEVSYISFSRNFGKESAMLAGLSYAGGDAVILMDGDLQHPPELIPQMVHYYHLGYHQVIAKRNRKGDAIVKSSLSKLYYKLMNKFVDVSLVNGVGDFRLLSRKALNALLSLNEYNRFSKGLFSWIGFKEYTINYDNVVREEGESKWTLGKLFNYGIDGVISFNNKPLRISIYMGLSVTLLGFIYILTMLIKILFAGIDVPGYFTLISAVLIIGGLQLTFLGIVGEYIGRIYYESKKRPHYVIEEESLTSKHEIHQKWHTHA